MLTLDAEVNVVTGPLASGVGGLADVFARPGLVDTLDDQAELVDDQVLVLAGRQLFALEDDMNNELMVNGLVYRNLKKLLRLFSK